MVGVYLHTHDNASQEIVYGTQARYPCHLPSVLSGCQGWEQSSQPFHTNMSEGVGKNE